MSYYNELLKFQLPKWITIPTTKTSYQNELLKFQLPKWVTIPTTWMSYQKWFTKIGKTLGSIDLEQTMLKQIFK